MSATIQQICRYPVKGLNAEVLESVVLTPGQGLPDDRRFAVVYGLGTGAKRGFFDLAQEERLAQLRVAYDPFAPTVTLSRQARQVDSAHPTDQQERMMISHFFAGFPRGPPTGTPTNGEASVGEGGCTNGDNR